MRYSYISINIISTILETFFGLQQASLTSGCRRLGRRELFGHLTPGGKRNIMVEMALVILILG